MEKKEAMLSDIVYSELWSTQRLSFSGENFLIWKLKLSFVLSDRHLLHLLDPARNPTPTPTAKEEEEKYTRASALTLIHLTLDDNLLMEFADHPSAESLMDALLSRLNLRLRYSRVNRIKQYKAQRMAVDAHINQHIFRMRAMAKELEYTGVKIPDEIQAVALLNSLPEGWKDDVEGLLREVDGCKEDLSFDYVCRRLRILRDVRKWRDYRKGRNKFKGNCFNCGKQGHYQSNCPDQGSSQKKDSSSPYFQFVEGASTLTEMIYPQFKAKLKLKYDGSEYDFWKSQLLYVLRENKVEYVLKDPKPSEPTDSASEVHAETFKKWQEDDFTCRHLILGAMDDDLFISFHDYPTAKILLEALEACFNSPSTARKLVLLEKYLDHQMLDDTSIIHHILKMDGMACKLEMFGTKIPDEMQAVVLLDSLPESWDDSLQTLHLSINVNNSLTISYVRGNLRDIGQLREFMAERNGSSMSHDDSNRKHKRVRKGNCYTCGRPGHYHYDCPDQGIL